MSVCMGNAWKTELTATLAPAWYDPHKTLLFKIHGTVLPFVWKRCLLAFVSTFFVCFLWDNVREAKDPKKWPAWDQPDATDKIFYHMFRDSEEFFTMSTGFLTFILGFFNATVFSRWWTMRTLCGTLMVRTTDTVTMLAAYVKKGKKVSVVRRDLNRLLALAHKVVYVHTRRRDIDISELVAEGLLEADSAETTALEAGVKHEADLYSIVYGWFLSRLYDAHTSEEIEVDGRSWGTLLVMVQTNISLLHQTAGDLMMYVNQPPPMGYTHLMELMVTMYGGIATFGLVPRMHWMAPFVNCLLTVLYYGLYCVSLHMFDPFGESDHFGFDTTKFYNEVRRSAEGIEALVPPPAQNSESTPQATRLGSKGTEMTSPREGFSPQGEGIRQRINAAA